MFCFISSLRSPKVSDNWGRVCELFERTAASVFNQTCEDFRFVVACHEPPALRRPFDDRLEFIVVDYPEPKRTHQLAEENGTSPDDGYPKLRVEYDWSWRQPGMSADYPYMARDKLGKLLRAMDRVRELKASHVMSLDADDLVHRDLVSHVLEHGDVDGWYVERGWRYVYGKRWIEPLDNFNLVCGSCNILSSHFFSYPDDPEREQAADSQWFREGHAEFVRGFAAMGAVLRPLPFRAVVYITRHRESFSQIRQEHVKPVQRNSIRQLASSVKRATIALQSRRPCGGDLRASFAMSCAAVS